MKRKGSSLKWMYAGLTVKGKKEAGTGLTLSQIIKVTSKNWLLLDVKSYRVKVAKCVFVAWLFSISSYAATVNLAWDRSPDPNVAGYNIYRGTVTGGPYTKLNLMLIPQPVNVSETPMYTDMTPIGSSLSYYYVVRAASTGGVESANSNEVIFNPPPAAPTNLRIVSFSIANLIVNGVQVATGPPFPINYILPRQTPPREVPIRVTVTP